MTIPAGDLALKVRIPVRRDGTDERRERFEVTIGRPRGVRIGDGSGLVRVRDTGPPPKILGVDTSVTEPTDVSTTVDVPLQLSQVSGKRIRIVVATLPGTADDADFVPTRIRTVILPGEGFVVVPVEVLADAADEPDETFTVGVVRGRQVRIGRPATVTIVAPPPPESP